RWALPDATRCTLLRSVARAEPGVIFALVRERDTAEMRADTNDHEPLVMALLDARRVRLGVGQRRDVDLLRLVDLFLGPMEDEDRLRAPEHLDDLPVGDRSEID